MRDHIKYVLEEVADKEIMNEINSLDMFKQKVKHFNIIKEIKAHKFK